MGLSGLAAGPPVSLGASPHLPPSLESAASPPLLPGLQVQEASPNAVLAGSMLQQRGHGTQARHSTVVESCKGGNASEHQRHVAVGLEGPDCSSVRSTERPELQMPESVLSERQGEEDEWLLIRGQEEYDSDALPSDHCSRLSSSGSSSSRLISKSMHRNCEGTGDNEEGGGLDGEECEGRGEGGVYGSLPSSLGSCGEATDNPSLSGVEVASNFEVKSHDQKHGVNALDC